MGDLTAQVDCFLGAGPQQHDIGLKHLELISHGAGGVCQLTAQLLEAIARRGRELITHPTCEVVELTTKSGNPPGQSLLELFALCHLFGDSGAQLGVHRLQMQPSALELTPGGWA